MADGSHNNKIVFQSQWLNRGSSDFGETPCAGALWFPEVPNATRNRKKPSMVTVLNFRFWGIART